MTQLDTNTQLVRYNGNQGEEIALSVAFVQKQFCPKATQAEAFAFMRFCQAHKLNPFLSEAYLVKYTDNDSAQMMVGHHVWVGRALAQPNVLSLHQGIIVRGENGIERRQGAFYLPDEELLGGWAEIGFHKREPMRIEVTLGEYIQTRRDGQPNRFWKEKPATMIQKVALSQVCRLALPNQFMGMYSPEELDDDDQMHMEAMIGDGTTTADPELLANDVLAYVQQQDGSWKLEDEATIQERKRADQV